MLFIITVVAFIAVIIFALENGEYVPAMLLGWRFEEPIGILVTIGFFVGLVAGFFPMLGWVVRLSLRINALKKENKKLSEKNEQTGISYQTDGLASESKPL